MSSSTKKPLRSKRWFQPDTLKAFGHRSKIRQLGWSSEDWDKPIIGIINTWSDINTCHAHFKDRVNDIKRGIIQRGGIPLEFPVLSLAEQFIKPTSMLYRNMLSMECEETLRSHCVDGAVLMGGCDKTTPALVMGAISVDIPFIYVPAGPMLRGNWRNQTLGSGSDAWKYWDELKAGNISQEDWNSIEGGIARSYGHCMTMGTASTMTAIAEALGLSLCGASSIPAADAGHKAMCAQSGRQVVENIKQQLLPSKVLTKASFFNALKVAMAMGCSTNAIIHLLAMARRGGVDLTLDDFNRIGAQVPVLANVRPSGKKYLMEDFFYAGGLPALMNKMQNILELDALTMTGKTIGEVIVNAKTWDDDIIRGFNNPVYKTGALAVLKGNLAPDGCVIKPAAVEERLLKHKGPALVFDSYAQMHAQIDDPNLDVTEDTVLIMRNAGPLGGPGMPEWGMLPIPKKLLQSGVRDMVRISDARMSGTSYGACILHVAPEAYLGSPLALVKTGDIINLDVNKCSLNMEVSEEELTNRRRAWRSPKPKYERGYGWMFSRHIQQANVGCDFDFLETSFGKPIGEPEIF